MSDKTEGVRDRIREAARRFAEYDAEVARLTAIEARLAARLGKVVEEIEIAGRAVNLTTISYGSEIFHAVKAKQKALKAEHVALCGYMGVESEHKETK